MAETVIKTEKLCFAYEDEGETVPVLHDVDMVIERGSFPSTLEPNETNKSKQEK